MEFHMTFHLMKFQDGIPSVDLLVYGRLRARATAQTGRNGPQRFTHHCPAVARRRVPAPQQRVRALGMRCPWPSISNVLIQL